MTNLEFVKETKTKQNQTIETCSLIEYMTSEIIISIPENERDL